jgi:hypothetical protein
MSGPIGDWLLGRWNGEDQSGRFEAQQTMLHLPMDYLL